ENCEVENEDKECCRQRHRETRLERRQLWKSHLQRTQRLRTLQGRTLTVVIDFVGDISRLDMSIRGVPGSRIGGSFRYIIDHPLRPLTWQFAAISRSKDDIGMCHGIECARGSSIHVVN